MKIDDLTGSEARQLLSDIADRLSIGQAVRRPDVILCIIDNVVRREACLSKIEDFHTQMEVDESGNEIESFLLRWGETPDQYIETYKAML